MSNKIQFRCGQCRKNFFRYKSLNKNKEHVFCSNFCYGKWRSENIKGINHPHFKDKIENRCLKCKKIYYKSECFQGSTKFCSHNCKSLYDRNGKIVNCEICGKEFYLRKSRLTKRKYCSKKCFGISKRNENNPNWNGGITKLQERIRKSTRYKKWRSIIFQRDNYICQECGYDKGRILNAHHNKRFTDILEENGIQTLEDALNCKELWDVNNGSILCIDCHKQTKTWGRYYNERLS